MLLALLACAPKVEPTPAPVVAAVPDSLPAPYTAEQLRAALPLGTQLRFRITLADGTTTFSEMAFVAVHTDGAVYRTAAFSASGEALGPPSETTAAWAELRDQAKFPVEGTKVEEASVTTALGTLDAWIFTVEVEEPGQGLITDRLWFAKSLPGPPVLILVEVDGAEVKRVEMIAHSGVTPPQ